MFWAVLCIVVSYHFSVRLGQIYVFLAKHLSLSVPAILQAIEYKSTTYELLDVTILYLA